jgi:beta-glucosidase
MERDDLTYLDVRVDDWVFDDGEFRVDVGASSRDIRCSATVTVPGEPGRVPLTLNLWRLA